MLRSILRLPLVSRLPVRVRKGVARGARWSLFPCTAYWRGTHEPEVQARVADLWDWTGRHAWDLGAHYGLFAVGLARRVGPAGGVAAFEPNPLSFARLRLHALRNDVPWLRLFPFAVGEGAAELPLIVYDGFETTSSHLPYEGETVDADTPALKVPVVRLDDLVAAGAITAPDFIKIDVEGHGHRALRGARETIARKRPVILSGLHSPHECAGIAELLSPLGYRAEPVSPTQPPQPTEGGDYFWIPSQR
jgi:FkbM family methyltransferase